MTRLPWFRLFLLNAFLLACPALAENPFVTSLPAQRLACVAGESPVEFSTTESLQALRKALLAAKVKRTGFPFFLEATPVDEAVSVTALPITDAQDPVTPVVEAATPDPERRLTWQACVPVGREAGQALHLVETFAIPVAVLRLDHLEGGCAEELENHIVLVLGEGEGGVPRSIPILQKTDTSSLKAQLEPFLTTEALEVTELARFVAAAQSEPIDQQLQGEVDAPRPLFAQGEPPLGPTQSGVICLVEVSENTAGRLSEAWSAAN